MGRAKLNIDPDQVANLAKLGATVKEISEFFHVSDTTITNRFMKELQQGRSEMKLALRKAQMKSALEGNITMQIWLGKQYLGQTDQQQLNAAVKIDNKTESVLQSLAGK